METFKEVKRTFKSAIRKILSKTNNAELDEAAFPAYAHKNPIIDYLFWERLNLTYHYILKRHNRKRVLDFGCGAGILCYLLAKQNFDVTGADIEFSPLNMIKNKIDFPTNLRFIEGDIITKDIPNNSFDVIIALDVMEHIENYPEYIAHFKRLLSTNGVVIVSGPTENILYKIGRKLAGNRFTGDYHVLNIGEIKKGFSSQFKVNTIKRLIFPFVLFEVFVAEKTECFPVEA